MFQEEAVGRSWAADVRGPPMALSAALGRLGALQATLSELAGLDLGEMGAANELRGAAAQCEALTCSAAALRHFQQRSWARSMTAQTPQDAAASAAKAPVVSESSVSATNTPTEKASDTDAPRVDIELQRREAVKEMETGGSLTMYLLSGKKKHDRFFWLENGNTICWDKKKTKPGKSNKAGILVSFEPAPATKTAREWFDFFDSDRSGELDAEELAQLYRQARGEKLKKKEVRLARSNC